MNIGEMRIISATGALVRQSDRRKRLGARTAAAHGKFMAMKDPTAKLECYVSTFFRLCAQRKVPGREVTWQRFSQEPSRLQALGMMVAVKEVV